MRNILCHIISNIRARSGFKINKLSYPLPDFHRIRHDYMEIIIIIIIIINNNFFC